MVIADNVNSSYYDTLYQKYCFRRAICSHGYVSGLVAAGFSENQILVIIGGNKQLNPDWQTVVSTFGDSVMGYFIDEPSGYINSTEMQEVQSYIQGYGSQLWLDDYDTGVIPNDYLCYQYHLADWVALDDCAYLMCDADNAGDLNGQGLCGTWLAQDYGEFLNKGLSQPYFNTIFTMRPYPSEGDVISWINNNPSQISNFALYLPPGWGWSQGDMDNFAIYAYQAGFLGSFQELYQIQYVCEQNSVAFTPGSRTAGYYYGVLTDGWYYTGPVDPSTPGAVVCWQSNGWYSLNQYQTVYAR